MAGERLDITLCRRLMPLVHESSYFSAHLAAAARSFTEIGDEPSRIPGDGVLIIEGNAAWYPALRRRLLQMPKDSRPTVVVWHYEPLPLPTAAAMPRPRLTLRELAKIALRDPRATDVYTNARVLRQLAAAALPDVLIVTSSGRRQYLAEQGISAHFVPLGADERTGRDMGLERDIDVLFLGALNVSRRRRIIRQLRRQGVNVRALGSWHDPSLWGEERTALLNRTRILLNLPRTAGEFSGARLLLGMINGAMVISEPLFDPEPYVPGMHYVEAPIGQLAEVIQHYLNDESARARIAQQGRAFAAAEVTMQGSVEKALRLISRHMDTRDAGAA